MRRKSVLLTVGGLVLLLGGTAAILALLVRHEPNFYRERAVRPGQERRQQSRAFQDELLQMVTGITTKAPHWGAAFNDAQLNSFLQEDFVRPGSADKLLPDDISEPRIALDPDGIRLGFRYRQGPWSTLISIRMKVWLAPKEINVVALELQGMHAGSLPISAQSLLEQISEIARRRNIEVTWYRHGGNPVALLRFQGDRPLPTVQLVHLAVSEGRLEVAGRSLDPTPRITACPPTGLAPTAN